MSFRVERGFSGCGADRFDGDRVGGGSGREDGEEGGALVALGSDNGYVTGVGVGGEEQVLVGGEGEGVGAGAGMDGGDELAVVDAVDANEIGAEVGDPEGGVVAADDAVGGFGADEVGTADLVGPGVDL